MIVKELGTIGLINHTSKRLPLWLWLKYKAANIMIKWARDILLTVFWNHLRNNSYHSPSYPNPRLRDLSIFMSIRLLKTVGLVKG